MSLRWILPTLKNLRPFHSWSAVFFVLCFPALAQSAQSSLAEECPSIDLNEDSRSPLRKIPIYDQGPTATCYAQAGAVLLNAYRLQKSPGAPLVDPLHMAVQSRKDFSGKLIANNLDTSGGQIQDSINSTTSNGGCSPETVRASFQELERIFDPPKTPAEILAYIENALNSARNPSRIRNTPKAKSSCKQDPFADEFSAYLEKNGLDGMLAIEALQEVLTLCEKQKITLTGIPEAKTYMGFDNSMGAKLFTALLKERSPVGISMASPVLTNPEERCIAEKKDGSRLPVNRKTKLCPSANKGEHFMHAVVVTGQKVINGECRVLVRNSWGSNWRAKEKDGSPAPCACEYYSSMEDTQGEYKSVCPESSPAPSGGELDFTEGTGFASNYAGCWVSREAFLSNTQAITVLREEKNR